jgi:hypothetical protein
MYTLGYVKKKGLTSEAVYPYTSGKSGKNGKCDTAKEQQVVARISGFLQLSGGQQLELDDDVAGKRPAPAPMPIDEVAMARGLVKTGPFTIAIDSHGMGYYDKGIDNSKACKDNSTIIDVNHEVPTTLYTLYIHRPTYIRC